MKKFVCKSCGLILAEGLSELQDTSQLRAIDREAMLPEGMYFISVGEFEPEEKGDVLVSNCIS